MKSRVIAAALFLSSAFNARSADLQVTVDTPSTAIFLDSKKQQSLGANADQTLGVSEPVWIEAPNRLPVILYPVNADAKVHLKAPLVSDFVTTQTTAAVTDALSASLVEVAEIQSLLQERQTDAAERKLATLLQRYPKVQFFQFLNASLLVLKGDRAGAMTAVRAGLEAHPDYAAGKRFLQNLERKSQ